MLRDVAVDLLMKRLGNRKDLSLRDDIINEMVYVQENILEGGPFYPFFLISEISDADTTAMEERVQLPTDFLHEWEDGALYYFNPDATKNSWVELTRDDWDLIKASYTTNTPGLMTHYDIVGNYFLLAPTPDAAYTLKFRYYAAAASLAGVYGDAANIENVWLDKASDWLIGEVGAIIASQYLVSQKLQQMFVAQAVRGQKRVSQLDVSMGESNKRRSMGDD